MSLSNDRHLLVIMVCIAFMSPMLMSGAAFAQDAVPDGDFPIRDKNEMEALGYVLADGEEYSAAAIALCAPTSTDDGPEGTQAVIWTDHPDQVKLKKNQAEVSQSQKENVPRVSISTGGGSGTITAILTCEKADVSVGVKTNKDHGKFSASAKNCTCVIGGVNSQEECDAYQARLDQVATDCDGFKSIKVDVDGTTIKKIKIKGKGDIQTDT